MYTSSISIYLSFYCSYRLLTAINIQGSSANVGGFAAVFDPKAAGYENPRICSCTDGVGTKLQIAHSMGKHDTIGIDLVAMSVNDLVVQGAEPLCFLDTYTCNKLDEETFVKVIDGICAGCR